MPIKIDKADDWARNFLGGYYKEKAANSLPVLDATGVPTGETYDARTKPPEGQPNTQRLIEHLIYMQQLGLPVRKGLKLPEFDPVDRYSSGGLGESIGNILKMAANQSISLGATTQMVTGEEGPFDLSHFDPNVAERLAGTLLSFADPVTVLAMSTGAGEAVKAGQAFGILGEAGAKGLLGKMVAGAGALGTYSGIETGMRTKDPYETAKATLGGALLGGLTGGAGAGVAGYITPRLGKAAGAIAGAGSEVATFGTVSPVVQEQRLPKWDDYLNAAGIIVGMKLAHGLGPAVKGGIRKFTGAMKLRELGEVATQLQDETHANGGDLKKAVQKLVLALPAPPERLALPAPGEGVRMPGEPAMLPDGGSMRDLTTQEASTVTQGKTEYMEPRPFGSGETILSKNTEFTSWPATEEQTAATKQRQIDAGFVEPIPENAAQARVPLGPATQPEAPQPVETPEKLAARLGIRFDGTQERTKGRSPLYSFTDPKTGGTLFAPDLKSVPVLLADSRLKFRAAEPAPKRTYGDRFFRINPKNMDSFKDFAASLVGKRMIKSGGTLTETDARGNVQPVATGSGHAFGFDLNTTEPFWEGKGYNYDQLRVAAQKAISGEPMTETQYGMLRDAYKSRQAYLAKDTKTTVPVSELNLKEGDEVRIEGDWHRVVDENNGAIRLQDGKTIDLVPFDDVTIDATTKDQKPIVRRDVAPEDSKVQRIPGVVYPDEKFVAGRENQMTKKALDENPVLTLTSESAPKTVGKKRAEAVANSTVEKKVSGKAPTTTLVTEPYSDKIDGAEELFGPGRAGVVLEHHSVGGKETLLLSGVAVPNDNLIVQEVAIKALDESDRQKKNLYLSREARKSAVGEWFDANGMLGRVDKTGRVAVKPGPREGDTKGVDDGTVTFMSGVNPSDFVDVFKDIFKSDYGEGAGEKSASERLRELAAKPVQSAQEHTPRVIRRLKTYLTLPESKEIGKKILETDDEKNVTEYPFIKKVVELFDRDHKMTGEEIARATIDKSNPLGDEYRAILNELHRLMTHYGLKVGFIGRSNPNFVDDPQARKFYAKTGEILDAKRAAGKMSNKEIQARIDALPDNLKTIFDKIAGDGTPTQRLVAANNAALGHLNAYFPRIMKRAIAQAIEDDLAPILRDLKSKGTVEDSAIANMLKDKSTRTLDLIKHIISTGQADSYQKAVDLLERRASQDLFPQSSFEKPRTLNLPSDVFEMDAKKVLPLYVDVVSKRIAQAKVVGPNAELYTNLLLKIHRVDPREASIVKTMIDISTGQYERDLRTQHKIFGSKRTAIDAFMAGETLTKIGLGFATVLNTTQTLVSTMPVLGVGNYLDGIRALMDPTKREFIKSTGVMNPEVLWSYLGYQHTGVLGQLSRTVLDKAGFSGINRVNALVAASSFNEAVRKWWPQAKRGDVMAQKQLEKYGLDWRKPLLEHEFKKKIFRFAVDNQLQSNMLEDPLYAHDPLFRPLYLFKRFGMKQFNYIKDQSRWSWNNGDKMFFLRLAAGGALGGELVIFAKNKIRWLLSGQDEDRPEDLVSIDRLLNNFAACGTMGILTDISGGGFKPGRTSTGGAIGGAAIGATLGGAAGGGGGALAGAAIGGGLGARYDQLGNAAERFTTPVVWADWIKFTDAYTQTMADWRKYGSAWLAIRRGGERLAPLMGGVPGAIAERMRTKHEIDSDNARRRGIAAAPILDAMNNGDGKLASHLIESWNRSNPDNPLGADDVTVQKARQRRSDANRATEDAYTWPGLGSVTVGQDD